MPQDVINLSGGNVDADFWTQWGSQTPKMALCVKITPITEWGGSSSAIGFTTNSRAMTLTAHAGITFQPTAAVIPTTVQQSFDVASVMELMGVYQTGLFTQDDILAGKWDGATVEVFSTCWNDETLGEVVWHKGELSEVVDMQTMFKAEIRGQLAKLSRTIAPVTTTVCRHLRDGGFRGTKCAHAASTVTISGTAYNIEQTLTITAVNDNGYNLRFNKLAGAANDVPQDFFALGKITANTTTNDLGTVSREIQQMDDQTTYIDVHLVRPFYGTVTVGDTFDLVAGCAGTIEDCMKYENIANRGAEDWIPGIEAASRIPDER